MAGGLADGAPRSGLEDTQLGLQRGDVTAERVERLLYAGAFEPLVCGR
jgi:hypothetical protein